MTPAPKLRASSIEHARELLKIAHNNRTNGTREYMLARAVEEIEQKAASKAVRSIGRALEACEHEPHTIDCDHCWQRVVESQP